MNGRLDDLISSITEIYQEIDRNTYTFQMATGMRCPPSCSACCNNSHVEASLLESLPLALHVLEENIEDQLVNRIDESLESGSHVCIFLGDASADGTYGSCLCYPFRPLLCRLFGYAGRFGKTGRIEFTACRSLKLLSGDKAENASEAVRGGLEVPVYQNYFMRVSTLLPDIGFKMLPINTAIKAAIEYLSFRIPPRQKTLRAA